MSTSPRADLCQSPNTDTGNCYHIPYLLVYLLYIGSFVGVSSALKFTVIVSILVMRKVRFKDTKLFDKGRNFMGLVL